MSIIWNITQIQSIDLPKVVTLSFTSGRPDHKTTLSAVKKLSTLCSKVFLLDCHYNLCHYIIWNIIWKQAIYKRIAYLWSIHFLLTLNISVVDQMPHFTINTDDLSDLHDLWHRAWISIRDEAVTPLGSVYSEDFSILAEIIGEIFRVDGPQ